MPGFKSAILAKSNPGFMQEKVQKGDFLKNDSQEW